MNVLRMIVAALWTSLWGTARWLTYRRYRRQLAFLWGRHESPEPMRCRECGWGGPLRWTVHTYQAAGWDDVEPVDLCPSCHSDTLSPAFEAIHIRRLTTSK